MPQQLATAAPLEYDSLPTDECLAELARYGNPRIGQYGKGNGWHANVDMIVSGKGVRFEIKSEFEHSTPNDALNVCLQRMRAALKQINGA